MGIIKLKTICWISVLFVCINIAVFPTGGRPEEPVATEKTEGMYGLPLVKERVTIDYFMANHKTKPFTANDLTIAELQRRTNVYFNIISIDSGYWDKYKVMLASNDLPDVVLLDINLTDIDGLEVLERINNSSQAPPTIMLTASQIRYVRIAYRLFRLTYNLVEMI